MNVLTMKSLGRRERKKQEKWTRILDAAGRLFREQGFEETTTRQVCEAADIANGTLFSYVDDKADLLVACFVVEMQQRVDRALETVPEAPLVDQLVYIYGHFFAFYIDHPRLAPHVLKAVVLPEGRARARIEALQLPFQLRSAALVQAAVARGELRHDVPVHLAAALFFGAYFTALSAYLGGFVPDAEALHEVFRAAVALQVDGMRNQEVQT